MFGALLQLQITASFSLSLEHETKPNHTPHPPYHPKLPPARMSRIQCKPIGPHLMKPLPLKSPSLFTKRKAFRPLINLQIPSPPTYYYYNYC